MFCNVNLPVFFKINTLVIRSLLSITRGWRGVINDNAPTTFLVVLTPAPALIILVVVVVVVCVLEVSARPYNEKSLNDCVSVEALISTTVPLTALQTPQIAIASLTIVNSASGHLNNSKFCGREITSVMFW